MLNQCLSLEDAIPKLLTCLCQSLDWELAEWWLVDGSLLKLNQYYVHSADTELRRFSLHSLQTTFTKGVNLPGLAWQHKTLQYLDVIENREQFRHHLWLGSKTFQSALALPILASDTEQVVGVILLATRSPKKLNPDQLTTLETIGNNIQQFLMIDRVNDELQCMKEALDHSALVTIADTQGLIIYANDKFCEISGYKRHELEGQTHRLIKSDHHSPDFFATLWKTISAGQVWQGEIKNRKKNGDYYWVKSTIIPFLDSYGKPFKYLSVRFDITELVAVEEKLKQKDTFLTSILNNVPQYIFWKDTKSIFLGCNQKFARSVGLEHPDQIIGKTDYDIYPSSQPARSTRYRQEDQHVLNSESPIFDILENRYEGGKDNWFTTNKLPLYNGADELIGILGTVENITDRIKAEAELQRFLNYPSIYCVLPILMVILCG
ncbi:MAG: PAS domain S-box protein [Synechococcaceae cyanobacterium RL_1_2]|nr:PAS domain S-box protein [Synechococcaceae cyanobacterium RL_1_2]